MSEEDTRKAISYEIQRLASEIYGMDRDALTVLMQVQIVIESGMEGWYQQKEQRLKVEAELWNNRSALIKGENT